MVFARLCNCHSNPLKGKAKGRRLANYLPADLETQEEPVSGGVPSRCVENPSEAHACTAAVFLAGVPRMREILGLAEARDISGYP